MMAPSASPLAASNPSITAASSLSPRQMRSMFSRGSVPTFLRQSRNYLSVDGAHPIVALRLGDQGTAAIASEKLIVDLQSAHQRTTAPRAVSPAEEDEDDEVEDDEEAAADVVLLSVSCPLATG